MRTFVFLTSCPPTRIYSPVSSTRSSLACVDSGSSPTSSRKSVPPLATPKYPSLSPMAPVNDPRSCPKSSESIVPSGMEPQLMARYFSRRRGELSCMMRGSISFPTPLSPMMRTERSVEATWRHMSRARFSWSQLPTTLYLRFISCRRVWSIIILASDEQKSQGRCVSVWRCAVGCPYWVGSGEVIALWLSVSRSALSFPHWHPWL